MIEKAKKLIIPAIAFTISLAIPATTMAVVPADSGTIVPQQLNEVGQLGIIAIVRAIIQFILVVAFVLAFIMLLIGGIRWITAGGDEKAVGSARNMITAALIGLVIVLVAFALIRLIETFFDVKIISEGVTIPTVKNTQ